MVSPKGATMAESITYPRVYELSSRAKAQWSAFYIAVIMCGLASGICWLYDLGVWAQATITGMGTLFAIGATLGLVSSLRGKLLLYQDYLDYHGIFALRRIRRDDIKETCNAKKEFGVFCITLVLKSGQPKRVQICDFGGWDDVFEDFINAYPNVEIEA